MARLALLGGLVVALVMATAWPVLALDRNVAGVRQGNPGGQRVALVIGNADYQVGRLRNPVNDARAMTQLLRELGFQVDQGINLSRVDMERKIIRFGRRLERGGVGLFYFSGHGLEVEGHNYLLPIGAQIKHPEEVRVEAVDADYVLARLDGAKNQLNILVLDACRNNPYSRSFRGATSGLAQMNAPPGTVIAYSTAPGTVAADGRGQHSPYTQALLENMRRPGLRIEDVFKRVRTRVYRQTGGRQVPWESVSTFSDFYMIPGQSQGRPPNIVVADAPGPAQGEVDRRKLKIRQLLRQAEADLAANRLTSPPGNNALERYQEVLRLEPATAEANQGIKRIVGKYVDLAQGRLQARDWAGAERYLERAERLREGDERVLALRDRLRAAQAGQSAGQDQTRPGQGTTPTLRPSPLNPQASQEPKWQDGAASGSAITIGGIFDLSGPTSTVGKSYARGVQAAQKFVNQHGGISGRRLRVNSHDYGYKIPQALTLYKELRNARVPAIIGWGMGDTIALSPLCAKDRIVYFSASFDDRLANPSRTPFNFFVGASYDTAIRAALSFAKEQGANKVAFIYPNHPFGKAPLAAGKNWARRLGLQMGPDEIVSLRARDATSQLRHLKEFDPQFAWFGGTTPSAAITLKDAAKLDLRTKIIINSWGFDENLPLLAGRSANGRAFGVMPVLPRGAADAPGFEQIRGLAGDRDITTHFLKGWVTVLVLAEGLKRAQRNGGISGPSLKEALETLRNFDTGGLTPPITFTAQDHNPTDQVFIGMVDSGRLKLVETVTLPR